jgi:hypothetical protein
MLLLLYRPVLEHGAPHLKYAPQLRNSLIQAASIPDQIRPKSTARCATVRRKADMFRRVA